MVHAFRSLWIRRCRCNSYQVYVTSDCVINWIKWGGETRPYIKLKEIMLEDCPVRIQQDETEFSWLFEKLKVLKPERIIEIGRLDGGTLYNWLKLKPKVIVSIDINRPNERMIKMFTSWAGDTEIKIITGQSQDARTIAEVKKGIDEADFIFVDGDHHERMVEQDWLGYWPILRKNGIMAFHDIFANPSENCTVFKVWQRLKEAGFKTEELINDRTIMGIGVVHKCS
jgi:predicted O-methyltransferase YrrM